MATSELSLEQIHAFFIKNGGTVTNRDVVRHFRNYLTDPASKDDARQRFKKYVNMLATSRMDGDSKILTLRPVYTADDPTATSHPSSPRYDPMNSLGLPRTTPPSSNSSTPIRAPPPYRPPPPVVITSPQHVSLDNISVTSSNLSLNDHQLTPQAPPRKRTSEKLGGDFGRSQDDLTDNQEEDVGYNGEKQTISVKERTQKFNRMASVDDELSSPSKTPSKTKKKQKDKGADEDDGASVTSLEPKKCAAWYVATAKGDYQELAKLASKEPRLVKLKDPYTTVLHWGSKHGNVEIIKLFAGTYRADVNAKTNGGYVPLHIAAQFGHEDVFDILTKVYKADRSVRDFYGKRPEQYKSSHIEARQKAVNSIKGKKNKYGDKDLGFLRIGSLNVRVKKTTEAFSSFLGVGGGGSMSSIDPISEKVHKAWGSADNLGQEGNMPAPKSQVTKRKSKRPIELSGPHSNPGTPNQPQRHIHRNSLQDSDSDTAAGFDSHWQN